MNFQKAYCIKLSSLVDRLFFVALGYFWGKKKKVPMDENLSFH